MTERFQMIGRMRPRDPHEPHRVSTNLELLFDLTFVVAVARVAAQLGHHISENSIGSGVAGYLMVFFAIWWAWMNFTWFASAYDVDDPLYRVLTLLQMAGVLVLAAGVPSAFDEKNWTAITVGYVIMRVAMVLQWLRAAVSDSGHRRTNLGYAGGILVVQLGWIARLWLPDDSLVVASWAVLVVAEFSVPLITERQGMTPWHPHHIAERYGLFTIIVLGESVTAASVAVSVVFDVDGVTTDLVMLSAGALILLFGLWWIYFMHETGEALENRRDMSFVWGYSHVFVAASAAALGASIEAAAEYTTHHATMALASEGHGVEEAGVSGRSVALMVAAAVSVFVLLTSYVHSRLTTGHVPGPQVSVLTVIGLLAVGFLVGNQSVPLAVLLEGLVLTALVVYAVSRDRLSVVTPSVVT